MLLFLTTNMAAVTSRANQQFGFCDEWKLVSTNYDQIQVKQIILKDSGG